jgi:hypothetical protein
MMHTATNFQLNDLQSLNDVVQAWLAISWLKAAEFQRDEDMQGLELVIPTLFLLE